MELKAMAEDIIATDSVPSGQQITDMLDG